jgi:hypothetical protein
MLTYMEAMLTCWVDMHLMHDRRLPLLAMPCLLSLTTLLIRYIILSTLLNLPTLLNPHAMLSLTDGWLGGLPRHTAASNRARPIIDDHMEGLEDGEQVFVQASARVACCRADAVRVGHRIAVRVSHLGVDVCFHTDGRGVACPRVIHEVATIIDESPLDLTTHERGHMYRRGIGRGDRKQGPRSKGRQGPAV